MGVYLRDIDFHYEGKRYTERVGMEQGSGHSS